jgi:hypothetical protein
MDYLQRYQANLRFGDDRDALPPSGKSYAKFIAALFHVLPLDDILKKMTK